MKLSRCRSVGLGPYSRVKALPHCPPCRGGKFHIGRALRHSLPRDHPLLCSRSVFRCFFLDCTRAPRCGRQGEPRCDPMVESNGHCGLLQEIILHRLRPDGRSSVIGIVNIRDQSSGASSCSNSLMRLITETKNAVDQPRRMIPFALSMAPTRRHFFGRITSP